MIQKEPHLINFGKIGNSGLGFISVAERSGLPFAIRRVYWTYYTPHDVVRGNHAHRRLEQIIIAVSGKIEFDLESKDRRTFHFTLDQPELGLYIPKETWRTIRFSHSAVLLCLASMEYEESDYIRAYEDFEKL